MMHLDVVLGGRAIHISKLEATYPTTHTVVLDGDSSCLVIALVGVDLDGVRGTFCQWLDGWDLFLHGRMGTRYNPQRLKGRHQVGPLYELPLIVGGFIKGTDTLLNDRRSTPASLRKRAARETLVEVHDRLLFGHCGR